MNIPSSALAAGFPFVFSNLKDDQGFFLGMMDNGGAVVFDLNKINNQRKNSNMFIIGTSGSGKSFTTKKLLSQLLLNNQKLIILDPEREYKSFCEKFNGK
jgi:type IV secretory pathway VirB4 component